MIGCSLVKQPPPSASHPITALDDWLQPGQATSALSLASNACGYDIILHLYKAAIEALQRPDARRPDHKSGRFRDCVLVGDASKQRVVCP